MKVRVSSMAPAAAKAVARVRPPSRNRPVMLRRPSSERAEWIRSCRSAGGDEDLGAGLSQGVAAGSGSRVRADDDQDGRSVEGREELGVEGEAGGESKTTRRGCRAPPVAGREQRVVGEDRADADRDRVRFGPPAVDQLAAPLARYPGRVAGGWRGPSTDIASFSVTSGRPVRACLRKGWFRQAGRGRLGAGGELDLDPAVAEDSRAPSGRLLSRVVGADHDPRDPGLEDRLRARRLAAVMGAGLERHVHRRPGRVLAARSAILERGPLGVKAAERRVKPFADDLPPRTITAPTSGFGLTRPRPPSASSSARSRCARSVAVSWGSWCD